MKKKQQKICNFGHIRLFQPIWAPLGPLAGSFRGSRPLYLSYHTLLSNIFQTRSFQRFSIKPLSSYGENSVKTAFFDGTLIPLSIPELLIMNDFQQPAFSHEMQHFFQLHPLQMLTLHEKMHRWANNQIIHPLILSPIAERFVIRKDSAIEFFPRQKRFPYRNDFVIEMISTIGMAPTVYRGTKAKMFLTRFNLL